MNGKAAGGDPTILFYVQHLRGVGHVFRASRVARALARRGARVHLAWGGSRMPSIDLSGLDVTWLDPVKVGDDSYSELVGLDGRPVDQAFRDRRRDTLLGLFERVRPDIVVTEAFPFGRRQMRFELEPLMRAARRAPWRPMTVASIRDIMQEGRADKRVAESERAVAQWFDMVLVHGDPHFIPIGESLQGAAAFADKIRYGGFVTPDPPDLSVPASVEADVVVSAGGGAFGHALTSAAPGAMRQSRLFPANWLVIAGPESPEAAFRALVETAPDGMRVERFVPDLTRVLAGARVSVSRAGYNTMGDLLRAGCRSVLVPYEGGRETEQLRRARTLTGQGRAVMLTDDQLGPETLAEAVDRAAGLPPFAAEWDLEGAAHAADIILDEHAAR